MVEGNTAKSARKHRHLLPPAEMVAARTMGEDDRRPIAVDLVIELNALHMGFWHRYGPPFRGCILMRGGAALEKASVHQPAGG